MGEEREPLHVVFAREVVGSKLMLSRHGEWVFCRTYAPAIRYDLDRAYCQELGELNDLELTKTGKRQEFWKASRPLRSWYGQLSKTQCEAVLRWAIAAKRAGVPVRLPGQSDTSAMGADGEPTGGPMR